jgi:hypothetical protein
MSYSFMVELINSWKLRFRYQLKKKEGLFFNGGKVFSIGNIIINFNPVLVLEFTELSFALNERLLISTLKAHCKIGAFLAIRKQQWSEVIMRF